MEQHHSNIPAVAGDGHRLTLSGVQQATEALLGPLQYLQYNDPDQVN
jgi:hypothetical protein